MFPVLLKTVSRWAHPSLKTVQINLAFEMSQTCRLDHVLWKMLVINLKISMRICVVQVG